MSTTPYRRSTVSHRSGGEEFLSPPRPTPLHTGTSSRPSMAGGLHTPKVGALYTPVATPFAAVPRGTPGTFQPFSPTAAAASQPAQADQSTDPQHAYSHANQPFNTPIPATPSSSAAPLSSHLVRPLSTRQPPGSLALLRSAVKEESQPASASAAVDDSISVKRNPPPTLTLPTNELYSPIRSADGRTHALPATPAASAFQPNTAAAATGGSAAPPPPIKINQPNTSAPVSTVKDISSSAESSLTSDRRHSASSNDNSIADRSHPTAASLAPPAASSLQPQKPILPPLTNAPSLPPPMFTQPFPMFAGGFQPFGVPPIPATGPNGQPIARPPFPPYPPYPIPVSIVSYGPGVPMGFGVPPPSLPQPQTTQPKPVAPQAAPASAPAPPAAIAKPAPQPAPQPTAAPNSSPLSPSPSSPAPPSKSPPAAGSTPPRGSSGGGVVVENLKSLDSRPTLTELELAAEKRQERDVTMFWLWILCALTMVAMSFHIHRYSFDKVLYLPFAAGGLALIVISLSFIVISILLIFLGRTIYERLPTILLFHAILALLVSFILYVPILVKYLPRSPVDAAFALELAAAAGRFSSSNSILAALVLHACSLGVFYIVLLRILVGERRLDESLTANERGELHASLIAVQSFEVERRASMLAALKSQRRIDELEEKLEHFTFERQRDSAAARERIRIVESEKEELEAILDGLDSKKGLDSRQAELYAERARHLNANHQSELKKLLDEVQQRQTFQLQLQKELALHQDELIRERSKTKAFETELGIIKLQMSNAGLEQSRILGLQEQLDNVTKEYNKTLNALHHAEGDLLIAKAGKCIHCESTRSKYDALRREHLSQAQVDEENATLKLALASMKQQLMDVHKRNLQLEQRTKKKIRQIEHDLDDFDDFTREMEP